jgi:Uma2 family endonuclease
MPVLTKHRFSTKEYHQMAETGVLPPNARVELLDGQIIDMPPIGPSHGGTTKRLTHIFTPPARGRWIVAVQDPVHLDAHSEPQPDVMLLRPAADFYTDRHPGPADVLLLIEVADTSLSYDRGEKLPAYGRAGIREVWIVNLPERRLEVYRDPHTAGYGSSTVLCAGDKASPLAFPDLTVDIAELLKQATA